MSDPTREGFTVERWIDSLHEDHNGIVWITKAELRAALSTTPAPNRLQEAVRLASLELDGQEWPGLADAIERHLAALSTTPAPDELWNRIAAIPFSEDGTLPDHAGPMLAPTLRDYRRRILETIRSTP